MRTLPVFALCLSSFVALAEPSPPISIEIPQGLHAGDRKTVRVSVALPEGAAEAVLLTTGSEGTALEVVRGRFLRPDAVDPKARDLLFDVPIMARAAGVAIFRAHLLAYRCAEACTAFEHEAQVSIEVAK